MEFWGFGRFLVDEFQAADCIILVKFRTASFISLGSLSRVLGCVFCSMVALNFAQSIVPSMRLG